MADGGLRFDYDKAKQLNTDLTKRRKEMTDTLNSIGKLVKQRAESEWEGASRQAFVDLFMTSSRKINEYLDQWQEYNKALIEKTAESKREIENMEKSVIDQATQELNSTGANAS
ncbi:MAG: WXG100 family type VII secretion target [Synergistaceae bacterium]|nr:WXG100 family type VII secretion target [Synergistaceae bacterium]